MLNLIKNEYAKIFHKKSTYVLLILLLLCVIGLPIISKLDTIFSNMNDSYYYATYEEEISMAEANNEDVFVELLKKAKTLNIPVEDIYDYENWKIDALNDLYYNYWYLFNDIENDGETYEDTEDSKDTDIILGETQIKQYQDYFNEGIKYVELNDWKGYYKLRIRGIDANPDFSDIEKKYGKYKYQYMLDHNLNPDKDNWQEEALSSYSTYGVEYEELKALKDAGKAYDEQSFETAESNTLISKYRLDNNINYAIYKDTESIYYDSSDIYVYTGELYNNMKNCILVMIFVMLIIVMLASGIVSKEFSQGTIKFLLINPVTRSKIIWSKYITVFSYAIILTAMTFIIEFIMSTLLFGFSELGTELLIVEAGAVISKSALVFMINRYLLTFVELFIVFTIAFMISSLFRNSALAITISIIVYFVSSIICEIAATFNLDFFRYTIFAVIDLTSIVDGLSSFVHLSTEFAVTVIAVHIVLLLLTAHDAFTKKNI